MPRPKKKRFMNQCGDVLLSRAISLHARWKSSIPATRRGILPERYSPIAVGRDGLLRPSSGCYPLEGLGVNTRQQLAEAEQVFGNGFAGAGGVRRDDDRSGLDVDRCGRHDWKDTLLYPNVALKAQPPS